MSQDPLPFPGDDGTADAGTSVGRVATTAAATAVPGTWQPAPFADVDVQRVLDAPPALGPFVDAGVLGPADVHVAAALGRLGGEADGEVLLAAALAVRAPRRRHVCVDLTTVRDGVVAELHDELAAPTRDDGRDHVADLPWPDPDRWRRALAASPLVAERDPDDLGEPDDAGHDVAPLTLAGDRLYLDRYWRHERRVATALDGRARSVAPTADGGAAVRAALDAAFDGAAPDRQRVAAAIAAHRRLTVVAGGPGTGKTTTVAHLLRVLAADARAAGRPRPLVALAAPTGKAASRLTGALREALAAGGDGPADEDVLAGLTATTIHRLLGSSGTGTRFRHGPSQPLPHDVVVVDETSMVPLALLAALLAAVRDDARLVLLGDPHQLASVEAGSVLADLVGDPGAAPARSAAAREAIADLAGAAHVADTVPAAASGVHDALVVLDRVHRFRAGSGLDHVAAAIRVGDADAAVDHLRAADDLTWIATHDPDDAALAAVRARVTAAGRAVLDAAEAGDGHAALAALDAVRVLCAHRRGSAGVAGWVARVEAWLRSDVGYDLGGRWHLGRPVLVTTNDRRLELWNGDLGVVVRGAGGAGVVVALPSADGRGVRTLSPARLGDVDTVHATTVHKAQGSQVGHAVVVLPEPASRICTRELLYTAVTRARTGATIVATEAALRTTIAATTQRASGLGRALGREPAPG